MGFLLRKFLCAITGTAFFLLSDAVPTHLRTANPLEGHVPLSKESLVQTTEKPKIVWSTTEKTRHETGGSEGCFGISTGSGGADLFALSPNVIAITFPEYGCKGQPTVAVCGTGVAERLQATMRSKKQNDSDVDDTDGDDVKIIAPVSPGSQPSTSNLAEMQLPAETMRYDPPKTAFRGTALELPDLKTLGCTAETSSIQYTAGRATRFSDPGRFALEEYSSFMSLKMPEPAVAKSVFLARVEPLGTIPEVESACIPAQTPVTKLPATESSVAVPCPETSPAPGATETAPVVVTTPISGNVSVPEQKLILECRNVNKTEGVPASMTIPATYSAPALLPGPVIVSVALPEISVAPASTAAPESTAARVPIMVTPAPVVYMIRDD